MPTADVTAYDATYAALMAALDAPLVTRASRLVKAARHLVSIGLV